MAPRLHVPLDVEYQSDEKILAAGPIAELVYIRALALAKRLLSDGRISRHHLDVLTIKLTPKQVRDAIDKLTADLTGKGPLWITDGEGWVIASWVKHNMTRAEVDAAQEIASDAGARGNHQRWHVDEGKPSPKCRYCIEAHLARPKDHRVPDALPDRGGESGLIAKSERREGTEKSETETGLKESPPQLQVSSDASPVGFDDQYTAALDMAVDYEFSLEKCEPGKPEAWKHSVKQRIDRDKGAAISRHLHAGETPRRAFELAYGARPTPPLVSAPTEPFVPDPAVLQAMKARKQPVTPRHTEEPQ